MNRRNFIRAAPAAAVLAPTLANSAMPNTLMAPTPYYGKQAMPMPPEDGRWQEMRVQELREMMSGKRNERLFPSHRHAQIAPSIDALRSVSAVNKHRILHERMHALECERRRFDMGWQLFDLIGVRS